jgi:hypothetical protein
LKVALEFSDEPEKFEVRALVLREDGRQELSESYENLKEFVLGPLTPGPRLLLVCSPKGHFAPALKVVTISTGEDTPVVLHSSKPFRIEGQVVDDFGRPLTGLEIEVHEFLPLDGSLPPLKEGATTYGGGGGTFGSKPGGSSYLFEMKPGGISWSQGAKLDGEGRFSLPIRSGKAPVTLQLRGEAGVLQETSILPSAEPLRLVLSGGVPPKK